MDQTNQITDLESLKAEKLRLRLVADKQEQVLSEDFEFMKLTYSPEAILTRTASKIVPSFLRRSSLVNVPINFLAKNLFDAEDNVVSTHSDQGKGNMGRNIALGVAEGVGAWLLTRFIKRKIFNNRKHDHHGKEF